MSEEKEDSRKTNKWGIIVVILLLAFLGFYLYNQYGFLFIESSQQTMDVSENQNSIENDDANQGSTAEGENENDTVVQDNQDNEVVGNKNNEESTIQDNQERIDGGQFRREIDLIIIGQDKKENVQEGKVQSDSIILANLKPDKKILTLTAVPSHKEYKGHKLEKYDRNQLMIIMNQLTDINPDYYFVIDYEGFKNIVNLISGVEVTLNKSFEVPELGLYLKEGKNLLSGQEALNYARYYDQNEDELTRIKRQQQVMEGFANKIFQKNTLLDIPRLYKTIIQTIKNVQTNFDYELAIEAYNFISNSSDFDIRYDVLEINNNRN